MEPPHEFFIYFWVCGDEVSFSATGVVEGVSAQFSCNISAQSEITSQTEAGRSTGAHTHSYHQLVNVNEVRTAVVEYVHDINHETDKTLTLPQLQRRQSIVSVFMTTESDFKQLHVIRAAAAAL